MLPTINATHGTPIQIAEQFISLLPAIQGVGATYYKQEALLALNAVLPAMFDQRLPISTQSVADLLGNPNRLLALGQDLPDGSEKVNLLEYLDRFSMGDGKVDVNRMNGVLGGLTARLAMSNSL